MQVLRSLKAGQQRHVTRFLDGLRDHPFREGELRERDTTGRVNELALLDDVLLYYWPDHAESTVRVTRLEVV